MTAKTATKAQAKFGDRNGAIVMGGILAAKDWDQARAHAATELAFCWMSCMSWPTKVARMCHVRQA